MQICDFGKAAIIERAIIRILQLRKNYVFGSVIAMQSTQYFQLLSRLQNSSFFAFSSKREQSNKRSGTRLKTESETVERR